MGPGFGRCRDSVGIIVPMYGEMGRVDVGMQNGKVDSLPMVGRQWRTRYHYPEFQIATSR